MNLHEYQAKQLFSQFSMPIPPGKIAHSIQDAVTIAAELPFDNLVVKAQVHAGGRGKAGGVKIISKDNLTSTVQAMLGTRLVTYQTDQNGQPVNTVLIEAPCAIARELYLGAVIDRSAQKIVIMASTEGGVEIEKVAHETPEKIFKTYIDPMFGILPYQARELGFKLSLSPDQIKSFSAIVNSLGKMFVECDLSLVEINPLVVTQNGELICLDGKINIDPNALYRHPELKAMRDITQEDEREIRASNWELNYIPLDGNIGCMVNGAGLAMATMDVIKLCGGQPANFLDVGGGATKERVAEAFKIILSDKNVKGVLINIFGGIVRCDLIAEGIIAALKEIALNLPVVVRLEGNNADLGGEILNHSGLNVIAAAGLTDAAQKIIKAINTSNNIGS